MLRRQQAQGGFRHPTKIARSLGQQPFIQRAHGYSQWATAERASGRSGAWLGGVGLADAYFKYIPSGDGVSRLFSRLPDFSESACLAGLSTKRVEQTTCTYLKKYMNYVDRLKALPVLD